MTPRFLNALHMRTKLTILITLVSAIAIALLSFGVIFYDISTFRQELSSQQRSLLQIVNSNIAAAIVFDDTDAIEENLALYKYQPNVLAVSIMDIDFEELATFSTDDPSNTVQMPAVSVAPSTEFTVGNAIYLQEEIHLEGEAIGYSRVLISLTELDDRVWRYIQLGALAMTITLVVAFGIARRFARVFSEPLEELVETAKEISRSSDYGVRVQARSRDEVGELSHYFNEMLEEIERRDTGLVRQKYSLEQLVERKTEEIRAALEESEAANQAKSEFLANMSHELRTPLNAILGFSEVMVQEVFGPHTNSKYQDYAGLIHESGAHLLDIINDLLDLAKVASGKTELAIEATNVTTLTNEVIEMMRVWAQRKNQHLSLNIHSEIPTAKCDRRMIKQVLVNLTSNAIKFTPDGGKIDVTLETCEEDFIRIIVSDTGHGMTSEEIKVAMEPFGQTQSIFSRSHEGTGLGLPLVEQFLGLHNATMHISSTPGEGTNVTLMLPIGGPEAA